MNVSRLISSIEALDLAGDEIVVSRRLAVLHAVYAVAPQVPVVGMSGRGPYILGRKNARRHVLVDANLADYPSIKQARADALTAAAFLQSLRRVRDDGLKSADADVLLNGLLKDGATTEAVYYPVQDVGIGRVPRAGRLEPLTRGGVQALFLVV